MILDWNWGIYDIPEMDIEAISNLDQAMAFMETMEIPDGET